MILKHNTLIRKITGHFCSQPQILVDPPIISDSSVFHSCIETHHHKHDKQTTLNNHNISYAPLIILKRDQSEM